MEAGEGLRAHGTPGVMVPLEEIGDVPIKYWRGDECKRGAYLMGAPRYTDYLNVKPLPLNCPLGCHRHIHFEYPDGTILDCNGPEYETIGMMGTGLLMEDLGAVAKANDIIKPNNPAAPPWKRRQPGLATFTLRLQRPCFISLGDFVFTDGNLVCLFFFFVYIVLKY